MANRPDRVQVGEYITSAEAAERLGLTQRRIAQLCAEGDLDCIKIARRWLVQAESVRAYRKGRR